MSVYHDDTCDFCGRSGVTTVGVGPTLPEQCGGGVLEVLSRCLECCGASSAEEYEARQAREAEELERRGSRFREGCCLCGTGLSEDEIEGVLTGDGGGTVCGPCWAELEASRLAADAGE
jgi:hypothetical protein